MPNRAVALGQYGPFDGSGVDPEGGVGELGFNIATQRDSAPLDVQVQTVDAVAISSAAGAAVPAEGTDLELTVSFSKGGAVLFHLHGTEEERVSNLGALKQHILEQVRHARWPDDRAVIIGVVHAASATALVSSARGASVSLTGRAGAVLSNLAEPSLDLRVSAERSMACSLSARGDLTPLYQALVLRRGLRGTRLERAMRSRASLEPGDPLAAAIDDDFTLLAPFANDEAGAS